MKRKKLRPGRKPDDGAERLTRHNVMLDQGTVKIAVEIGLGCLSVGIRKLAKFYAQRRENGEAKI